MKKHEIENYELLRDATEEFCGFLSHANVPTERIFDSKLVVYELLGNVLKHSDGKASLCYEIIDGFVEVKIFSSVPYEPPKRSQCVDVYSEHGRGIFLVDSLCHERSFTEDGSLIVRIKIK